MKEQMDRDTLLYGICPMHMIYDCCNNADTNYHCDDCKQLMNEWLDQYDKQIRADAIDECIEVFRNIPRHYYLDEFLNELEQLKEHTDDK